MGVWDDAPKCGELLRWSRFLGARSEVGQDRIN